MRNIRNVYKACVMIFQYSMKVLLIDVGLLFQRGLDRFKYASIKPEPTELPLESRKRPLNILDLFAKTSYGLLKDDARNQDLNPFSSCFIQEQTHGIRAESKVLTVYIGIQQDAHR